MSQKFSADLNIIAKSDIEVQIDPLTKDLNIIQKLDDEPNDVGGMSAQELKETFDRAGNLIKEYINDTLIPQVLSEGAAEKQREQQEQVRQDNEARRQAGEQARQENEAARVEAEAARTIWEDYDPARAYVPGNKVYWAGSSYVNTAPCSGVPPNAEAYWRIIAKRGATVGEGMTEEDGDGRYLLLSGGWMAGPMGVLAPVRPENPTPKGYLQAEGIQVTKMPEKTAYSFGERFDPTGMEVAALYTGGESVRVTGWRVGEEPFRYDTDHVSVFYTENRTERAADLALEMGLRDSFETTGFGITQVWHPPVYGGGVWVACAYSSSGTTTFAAYSEDYGETWVRVNLTFHDESWDPPAYEDGIWISTPTTRPTRIARSEDGKSWAFVPLPGSSPWVKPVYGKGVWVTISADEESKAAYSEDGGQTWNTVTLPIRRYFHAPVFAGGMWFIPVNDNKTVAYSEDGKRWKLSTLPGSQYLGSARIVCGGGTWLLFPGNASYPAHWSEDGGKTWSAATLPSILPSNVYWDVPVYGGGVWVASPRPSQAATNQVAYSEDGGKTWSAAALPTTQKWFTPSYANGVWVASHYWGYDNSTSNSAAYSEDGKTWKRAALPAAQRWIEPVFDNGIWLLFPYTSGSAVAAYSEDGKTWAAVEIPAATGTWTRPVFADGVWFSVNSNRTAAYSMDGKTWTAVPLSGSLAASVIGYGGGVWFISETSNPVSQVRRMVTFKRLAEGGSGSKDVPTPTLEDRVKALSAENAALAAAVERGLRL